MLNDENDILLQIVTKLNTVELINNFLDTKDINIYGTGEQTRNLLYVKDCARFVVESGYNDNVNGEILNAETGRDVTINELAKIISNNRVNINHVSIFTLKVK
ncbi:hypothetical protein psyc5s11_46750 [Clostridium gelidum]|uniref:NAD-dependent epimerase/dehydratase domain-containing protein n=1 Tax=Clostridium gelidum TaxID=704125 RepID=A0ABM7TBA9_9CLOT|nr:hypothetical protein psyc5s11_46750 [Clostridium gelidum]